MKTPFDRRACVLFDGVLPIESATYYFVDNGGDGADYSAVGLPVTDLATWLHKGTGVVGGIRYYYSLFSQGANGQWILVPGNCIQSAYAYSHYGHAPWLKKQIPRINWQYDTNGDLAGIVNCIGLHFDTIKTDVDRLEQSYDAETLDFDLLPLLENMLAWPQTPDCDPTLRRREIGEIWKRILKKGRLDNLLDILAFAFDYRPRVHREWRSLLTANSNYSPRVKLSRVETIERDFSGDEGWITVGDTTYWGELGVQTVSKLWLDRGFDWPLSSDYFVGQTLRIETEPAQVAIIAAYDPMDASVVVNKLLTSLDVDDYAATELPYVQILLGTPRLRGVHSPNLTKRQLEDRSAALLTTPAGLTSRVPSGLRFIIEPNDNRKVGPIVDKLYVMHPMFMSVSTPISCYIKTTAYIDHVRTPGEAYTLAGPSYTDRVKLPRDRHFHCIVSEPVYETVQLPRESVTQSYITIVEHVSLPSDVPQP